MIQENVLFVGDGSRWSELAADYLRREFIAVDTIFWDYGDPKPKLVNTWIGDRIFCFKADLILSPHLLRRARKTAINFHPAIPQYPGIGGYDYVIYDKRPEYGVTCHHITPKVDAGPIIDVKRFPVLAGESAASLHDRAAAHCLLLLYEIVQIIATAAELPTSDEKWAPKLYTRAMLEEFHRTTAKATRKPA